jgi:nitroimidazol reductase NimA-like FMN-containing flavoprotein (pyridoxamine 5'-phosphate oxidase superfamily)
MTTRTGTPSNELVVASRPRFRASRTDIIEMSREECLNLLASHRFGRLAVVMSNGSPAIRPVNYIFDRATQSVVFRTSRGSKLYALLHAARAAFEIDGIDEATQTGWSVIVEGASGEVTFPTEIGHLEHHKLRTWAPGHKPHWVQIRARTVSGRRIVLSPEDMAGYYLG